MIEQMPSGTNQRADRLYRIREQVRREGQRPKCAHCGAKLLLVRLDAGCCYRCEEKHGKPDGYAPDGKPGKRKSSVERASGEQMEELRTNIEAANVAWAAVAREIGVDAKRFDYHLRAGALPFRDYERATRYVLSMMPSARMRERVSGEDLRPLRERFGVTRRLLATRAEIPASTLAGFERGSHLPTLETYLKLSETVLQISSERRIK